MGRQGNPHPYDRISERRVTGFARRQSMNELVDCLSHSQPKATFMKNNTRLLIAFSVAVAAAAAINPPLATAASTPSKASKSPSQAGDSAAAWKAVEEKATPPRPPAEWREKEPTPEAVEAWRKSEGQRLSKAADAAHDFYTRYPKDPKAKDAKLLERELLEVVLQTGDSSVTERLDKVDELLLNDPTTSKQERLQIRYKQVARSAKSPADLEVGARELLAEFPGEPQVYQLLLMAAMNSEPERSRAIAEDIRKSNAPAQVKVQAEGILKRLDALGKPFDLKFTAIDGREVDVQKMKGKVVLIDFWATWCQPCVAELPKLKDAYAKLHDKGFEIVGISLDQDKTALEKFIKENDMPWPQYFDGKGFESEIAANYGIFAIPTVWLVDKKGILREMNAREDLQGKVEKLLAEP